MAKRRTAATSGPAQPAESTRAQSVHFDRVEADASGAERAVLIVGDGRPVVIPRDLLPIGATPGSTLLWTLAVDTEATEAAARGTAEVRAQLKKTDPGGTIHL